MLPSLNAIRPSTSQPPWSLVRRLLPRMPKTDRATPKYEMESKEKLQLLKSLELLKNIPEESLSRISQLLEPVRCADNDKVFQEGDNGDSLYFISSGQIRIEKKAEKESGLTQVLAYLHPGDCFGEMALIEEAPRSATAIAQGEALLFKLGRKNLFDWLGSQPIQAMAFFAKLVQVLSRRLRRTSNELALLFDFSNLLLEPFPNGAALLKKVLQHILRHLEGQWGASAYLYNPYTVEMESVYGEGEVRPGDLPEALAQGTEYANRWLDGRTYYVSLPGDTRAMGYLLFESQGDLTYEERDEFGRTLTTLARLITCALDGGLYP